MKEKGVGVQELADKLGVSRQALSRQINGNLMVDTAQRIADALGVSIAELFESKSEHILICPHCGKEIKIKVE